MIKRLTRSVLVAAMMVGLCHSMSSGSLVYADQTCESCDSTTMDYAAEGYLSDMGGVAAGQGVRGLRGRGVNNTGVLTCEPWEYGNPDLFYNYYVPNNCGAVPAQLYVSPLPVPGSVGHTYVTYQPFMPHEMTYPHYRTYRQWYDDGRGMTRAKAHWYRSPVTTVSSGIRNTFRLPR